MPLGSYAMLIAGLACAGLGGEVFVRGVVGLAHWARVSPGIIAATVAAFATSSPELSVSLSAAMAGKPQIALGDALGSNVVNVALILGLALLVSGLKVTPGTMRRDFPVALASPVLTGALFIDGTLSRIDGLILLFAFAAWLAVTLVEARSQRSAAEGVLGEHRALRALGFCVLGLVLLVGAGQLIVNAARAIAESFGIDEFVIGALVVAVGTSVPELATAIISALRGHSEIGIGTILGSNLFNGLFVIALAATIHPISVDGRELAAALVFGLLAVALAFPSRGGGVGRWRGGALLVLYLAYLSALLFAKTL